MKAKIKFKGKELVIEDLKKVSSVGKYTGLMFKKKETQALLFEFPRGRKAIHSLFCPDFLAVWLLEGKIVEYKLVLPYQFYIAPKSEFDKLIEIPVNEKYKGVIEAFLN